MPNDQAFSADELRDFVMDTFTAEVGTYILEGLKEQMKVLWHESPQFASSCHQSPDFFGNGLRSEAAATDGPRRSAISVSEASHTISHKTTEVPGEHKSVMSPEISTRCSSFPRLGTSRYLRSQGDSNNAPNTENIPQASAGDHDHFFKGFATETYFKKKEAQAAATATSSWKVCLHSRRIVESTRFDYLTAFLILLNSLMTGAQTELMTRDIRNEDHILFQLSEKIFCILFTGELILRMAAYGCSFFYGHGWRWNYFDCVVVALQLVEEFMTVMASFIETPENGGGTKQFQMIRVLRVFRMLRVLRLARIMHLIGELRTIIVAIMSSMQALWWTLVLLMLLVYVCAVFLTQLVTNYVIENSNSVPRALTRLYGSLFRSFLTLYQVICGGIDWDDALDPLMKCISPFLAILFCLYIAFVIFALMNVVTGVFVESALKSADRDKDLIMLQTLRDFVNNAGMDTEDSITWEEFETRLDLPEMRNLFKAIDLDPQDALDLFQIIDINRSGTISSEELIHGCLRIRGPAKAIDLVAFIQEFRESSGLVQGKMRTLENQVFWLANELQQSLSKISRRNVTLRPAATDSLAAKQVGAKMSL